MTTEKTITTKSIELGGKTISIETGRVAAQANGAVLVRCGDTMVLVTATGRTEAKEGIDFFPLTVDIEERMYAAGKIPGGFIKREARPSEKAILTARLIDRPVRPRFPKGFSNETQLIATILSTDQENAYDMLAMLGASAALHISEIPFQGPIAAVRVGRLGGELILNPTMQQTQEPECDLDMIVAGTAESILMIEAGGDEITEDVAMEAVRFAQDPIRQLCELQNELREAAGKPKWPFEEPQVDKELYAKIESKTRADLDEANRITDKKERSEKIEQIRNSVRNELVDENSTEEFARSVSSITKAIEKDVVRKTIAVDKRRPDGREVEEVREITVEVGVAPRTHGSALFTRGQTQAMTLLTLGAVGDYQRIDGLGLEDSKRYIHHYNFPPFSVGETGFMRGPKRRDIGHGALAEKALRPMIPDEHEFPYTIRLVSEILESNGSSSMASTCGSTLALMDAGVPIKTPIGGIACGLVVRSSCRACGFEGVFLRRCEKCESTDVDANYVVLTDIAGIEDHLGDMDFKVTGSKEGITAIQMDLKIKEGITPEVLEEALAQSKRGRLHVIGKMVEVMPEPRTELSEYAPRIFTVQINPDKIGALIGKGGETIRGLVDEFDASIDVEEDGTVFICARDGASGEALIKRINELTKDVEAGDVFVGKVVKTTDFGAFVELKRGTDGLVHISNLAEGRVNKVEDVVKRGQMVQVEVIEVKEDRGKQRIGLRVVDLNPKL
ncbi:MAG: polyribonucleotide nucleotidyltransferase [Actinobacteria bacterium]|nr:polyribonucleotide nucleotidyltransferase [Actinomycetota bacterium]MCL5883054.1 polyribonucleotide nucleotidyltransferase [Actinomycetota bacterium]